MSFEMNEFFRQTNKSLNRSSPTQIELKNDRLLHSISMIKEILMSNMQLREEQLKLSEEHDRVISENYQL